MKMAASRARGEPWSNVVLPERARWTARSSWTRGAASAPLTACLEVETATAFAAGPPLAMAPLAELLVGAGFFGRGAEGFLALVLAEAAREWACDLPAVFEDFAILLAVARTSA